MFRLGRALLCAAAIVAATPPPAARAHGDHDAGAPAEAATLPSVTAEGDGIELVGVVNGHVLTVYLDRKATNTPIDDATIEVVRDGGSVEKAEAAGNGVYELEADWLEEPGAYPLTFTVQGDRIADLLAGRLVIPAPETSENADPFSWNELLLRPEAWIGILLAAFAGFFISFAFRPLRLPPDGETTPEASDARAETGPASGTRTKRNAAALVVSALALSAAFPDMGRAHEGHDHGAGSGTPIAGANAPARLPGGDVYMPKAAQRLLEVRTEPAAVKRATPATYLIGTVVPDPSSEGRVQAPMEGQIELAEGGVSFVGQRVAAGQVLAVLSPAMPVYERGALSQLTAEVEGKLRIAEQRLRRLKGISGDYIPQRELDDTETEIESLLAQKKALEPRVGEKIEMLAPVSGVISVANVRAGQVVSARDTLFEIVDPERVWIEAAALAGADETSVTSATALDGEGHAIPLAYIGRAPSLRQQSQPLLFDVRDPHPSLAIGVAVKVLVQGGEEVEGIVAPAAAVVRATNGLSQVWIKTAPERFSPHPVRTRALDGERVLIVSGVEAGDRVVVQGAELINQVR